jgi:hypothetical protein
MAAIPNRFGTDDDLGIFHRNVSRVDENFFKFTRKYDELQQLVRPEPGRSQVTFGT